MRFARLIYCCMSLTFLILNLKIILPRKSNVMDIKSSDKPNGGFNNSIPIDDWWEDDLQLKTPRHNPSKSGSHLDGVSGRKCFVHFGNKQNEDVMIIFVHCAILTIFYILIIKMLWRKKMRTRRRGNKVSCFSNSNSLPNLFCWFFLGLPTTFQLRWLCAAINKIEFFAPPHAELCED
jgi:hypothetical protein